MKVSCWACVLKHIATAKANHREACLGYPEHMLDVVGELCEAEEESYRAYPEFAELIRQHRKDVLSALPSIDYFPPYYLLWDFALQCLMTMTTHMEYPAIPKDLRDGDHIQGPKPTP